MKFCHILDGQLDEMHLLKHPFYQAWSAGDLGVEKLQFYAKEYYSHVAAFPRYISSIHSLCSDIKSRQILLENLIEEEKGEENHPELWLRFAEGLGVKRQECQSSFNGLAKEYFDLVRSNYATGLGALYAYERQTPEVSKSKIEGLRKHYGLVDKRALQFFETHVEADLWHREEIAELIENLDPESRKLAANGAMEGSKLLWSFLDEIIETNAHQKL